ncbi:MAG TPA: hypothetical protein VHY35_23250 [Stellaceae bacterium]|nr:hypothetical protein [Stellaceae bacterium]
MADQDDDLAQSIVAQAQRFPVQIYVNMFVNNIGAADISTILLRDTTIVGVLHMSYQTAKAYGDMLLKAVQTIENKTGVTVLTPPEIAEKMSEGEPE